MFTTIKTTLSTKTTEMKQSWRQMRTEVKFETVLRDLKGERLLVEITKLNGATAKGHIVAVKKDTVSFRPTELLGDTGFDSECALLFIPVALIVDITIWAPVAPPKAEKPEKPAKKSRKAWSETTDKPESDKPEPNVVKEPMVDDPQTEVVELLDPIVVDGEIPSQKTTRTSKRHATASRV